jgi:site-specific recombinase XerD
MSRFAQTSDVPPVRLVEFGIEKSEQTKVLTEPVVATIGNLRSQRIEQFLALKNLAATTRRNYERHLRQFGLWVNKDWHQITMNDLKRYKTYLESGRQLKQGSVGAVLTALKSFFSWLKKAGYIEENPGAAISIPVTPETEGKNLELFQVEALFEALAGRKTQRRDQAILCLMVYAGLRAEEISHLNAGDYNGVEVIIRKAKHGSVGRVPVDEQTDAALRANLRLRLVDCEGELKAEDPMFASYSPRNWGQRLGYEGIYKMVKALAKDAGWPDIHPHKGRHTYASQLIEDGMDAYLAMTLMRQRSVKAFEVYSQQVRYRTAKAVFLEGKGELERQPMSLEDLVLFGEAPGSDDAIAKSQPEGIELEAVVEEPSKKPQIRAVDIPLQVVQVGLKLWVSGWKKGKVRRAIEERVLSEFQMVKLKPRGNEYRLMIPQEEDLAEVKGQMFWEMDLLAELDDCSIEVEWLGVV